LPKLKSARRVVEPTVRTPSRVAVRFPPDTSAIDNAPARHITGETLHVSAGALATFA